ncbi:MAG: FN3 associated domain-containing protein [Bacteroidota bacterium]
MQRVVGNILFVLNILLLFFLIFDQRMEFPAWLQSIGRIHPLLLHLPIGAVVIVVIGLFLKKPIDSILTLAAITAALTAIMGIILSKEGGYSENDLAIHKYSGALLSFILCAAYFISNKKIIVAASFIVLLVAGHFGSILTHGDEFVLAPLIAKKENKLIASDSTSLYAAAIQPIFHQKCTGCHNEKKAKGDLVLSTLAGLAKGGEHGIIWKAGSPQTSLLMKRVLLPETNEDHMPPQGKAQLSAPEVQLLYQWILSGADTAKAWTRYHPSDTVRKLADQFIRTTSASTAPHYTFDPASPEVVSKLNDPYRVVAPVALNEPALSATFFIKNEYKSSRLEELSAVKEQLVELNLSKMPVSDADCETIRKFEHLEKLNLNFSSITEKGLKTLSSLPELTSISVAGTSVTNEAAFKDFKKLKEIFIWDTSVDPYKNETLALSPPIPTTDKTILDEKLVLTHKLPGTVIRYTTDGSDPDSTTSKVYDGPIDISGYTTLKTRACKDGWFCSRVGTYTLYKKGVTPVDEKLLTAPNKDYRGEGIETLVNNKTGYVDYHRDISWVGFRENPLSAEFTFADNTNVKEITLCYDHNPGAWLFPPSKIEILGGDDLAHLKVIKEIKPGQPQKMESTRNAAIVIPVETHKVYKIIAWPVAQLPKWHPSNNKNTKDQRAWLFVDEVIFNN